MESESDTMSCLYYCPICGGRMLGDGYSVVSHCENVDLPMDVEPDSDPIFCDCFDDKECGTLN